MPLEGPSRSLSSEPRHRKLTGNESLVPLHRPGPGADSGNPAMCISLPAGEKADFLGPRVGEQLPGRREHVRSSPLAGEGLTVDTQGSHKLCPEQKAGPPRTSERQPHSQD